MFKKFIRVCALVLTVAVAISGFAVCSFAETSSKAIEPRYDYTSGKSVTLSVSGTTANCQTDVTGKSTCVKISVVQTLQKQGALWTWSDVIGASWTKTANSRSLTMSNSKSGLASGTYRVKSVITVTGSDGKTETITAYSDEKEI